VEVEKNETVVCLKMDFYPFDLYKLLSDSWVRFTDSEILHLARQTGLAVQHLHQNFIVHRDLKPANFLLDTEGNAVLTDFGLARHFASPGRELTKNVITRYYRPPEVLFGARFYSEKVDVWSLGCIWAEMFLKKPLFLGSSEIEQLSLIFGVRGTPNKKNWPDASSLPLHLEFEEVKRVPPLHELLKISDEDVGNLLERMLTLDPKKRPSLDEVLADPVLNTSQVNVAKASLIEKLTTFSQRTTRHGLN